MSRTETSGDDPLIQVLSDRFAELLPDEGFRVRQDGRQVTVEAIPPVRGAGSAMVGSASPLLQLPLPARLRLRMFFENEARALQEFVSRATRTQWPAPKAQPHVRVDDDAVHVWYGGDDETQAALRWTPVSRKELGL